ncbi:MAG: hypothetical protein WBO06_06825 [Gammaproteobacteria bacterium]
MHQQSATPHPALPAAVLLLTVLLGACSTGTTQGFECPGQQVMITFTAGVDATDHEFNAGLARAAGIRLDYMRPLFDDHHLYCALQERPSPTLDAALERLRERADVRAVEIDRIKHPASK